MKKQKVYTFLGGYYLMIIDSLKGRWGNQRSEVIRKIIENWVDYNGEMIKVLLAQKQDALEKGYIKEEELLEDYSE
jgi:hypothetical protein